MEKKIVTIKQKLIICNKYKFYNNIFDKIIKDIIDFKKIILT